MTLKEPVRKDAAQIVRQLSEQLRRWEEKPVSRPAAVVSTGVEALDGLLAERGYRRGTLVEWIGDRGAGAATLALQTIRPACAEGGATVVVDRDRLFYPPAAIAFGIDLRRLIVVRPANVQEEIWALDQSLRCPGVAAVVGWVDRLDDRSFRRLQLSAELGEGLGLFLRPPSARCQPTWAETRWLVESMPASSGPVRTAAETSNRRARVTLLRSRNAPIDQVVELEIDGATTQVRPCPAAVKATSPRTTA